MNIKLKVFLFSILISVSSLNFAAGNQHWDFENTQRWIGDSAEGKVDYCSEKSIRWTNPQLGFDINQDSVDDFMMPISCYQGEAVDGEKHNLKVRAAWKMYCSNEGQHYDCTSEVFGSEVIEATAVADDISLGSDGGGNAYIQVSEAPRDLNNDGYPEFWYAVNRDDGRYGFDETNTEDRELLEKYCGPPETNTYTWDCTRKSIQTMLISRPDGTYQIVKLPWGAQNTQAVLILPNTIGTFDAWAMIYGPHKVARFENNSFTDVTAEYEQDPLWMTVGEDGGPYAKAFEIDGSFYIARADIPAGYRPSWAEDVVNSGFMLWKYIPGEGFSVSDVYTPEQEKTFEFQIKQGESTQIRYGAMVKDVPVFDPRWHFFDLEILDDSKEPVLMVQSEAFTQVGSSYKAPHNSNTTYEIGDLYAAQNTDDKIYGGHSAIEGFFIRDGKLIPREKAVIASNGLYDIAFKRFVDINSDGYLDIIASSGGGPVLPSVYLNDGKGMFEKLFLGDIFPDLYDEQYWQVDSHNVHGWGASIYPFYESNSLDLLFWTKGFSNNIPTYAGDDFVFSPGDIALAKASQDISVLNVFSPAEQHVLLEKCYSSGWMNKNGYQLPCRMGIPFPDETEIDTDGDGIVDSEDDLRFNSSESVDTDNDGIGNNADTDDDGDGVLDLNDTFPLDANESVDSDSDGTGDNSDVFPNNALYSADSDSDGMPDAWETKYGLNPNDASDATSDQDNDGVTALDEFLAGTIPSGSLDIDGNENYDALTDGLLLLRGMFGLDGSALITGTVASDAAYTEPVDIESRIATLGDLADIDGNGTIDALTDGLLTLRYLFGLQGDTLINGVVSSNATRTTADEIEAHLETLMPTFASTDNTPVITLVGSESIEVVYNAVFGDLGAEAHDDSGAAITVTTQGTVNTSMPGNYELTYTATDVSGNWSQVTRTVVVLEDTSQSAIITTPQGPFSFFYDGVLKGADYWSEEPQILSAGMGFDGIVAIDAPELTIDSVRAAGGAWSSDIYCGSGGQNHTTTSTRTQVARAYIIQEPNGELKDGAIGLDGLPIVLSWPIDTSTLSLTDFQFTLNTGDIVRPLAVGPAPNIEDNERNTPVVFGEFGNRLPSDHPDARFPITLEIVEDDTPLEMVGPDGQVVSAVGLTWETDSSPYDENNGPRLVGAKLNRIEGQMDGEGISTPLTLIPANDATVLYDEGDFMLRMLTTGGFSPDGVSGLKPNDFERFFRIHANGADGNTVIIDKVGEEYAVQGGMLRVVGLSDLGQAEGGEVAFDACYDEDRDNYIDIILVGDEDAARNITILEIPSLEEGYSAFYNPGGPGGTPFEGVNYSAPGPRDLEPVIIALDDPMRVTYFP